MKKFYAFAAAALAAVSMNAQTMYVCGAGDQIGWNPGEPLAVELANGVYTFEVTNLTQFKVSSTFGSWDDYNAGAYTCTYAVEDLGNPVELVVGDGNIGAPYKGDYKIVVAGDFSTITMTTDTPMPDMNVPVDVYIKGDMNGWGNDDAWKFTAVKEDDTVTYTFEAKGDQIIPANLEFKIADADWNDHNWGYGANIPCDGDEYEWYYNGDNSSVAEDFEGTIVVVSSFSSPKDPAYVSFTPAGADGVADVKVDANAPAEYFNLQGVRVANPENGLYIVRKGNTVSKIVR